jgi:Predicted membrane protein (DUF2207) C-terminal domain
VISLSAAAPTYDGFHDGALAALVGAIVVGVAWVTLVLVLWFRRAPRLPRPGPETAELGDEPPAVVNLLVNQWSVTSTAVPATLVDLAARRVVGLEEVGPHRFVVRTRSGPPPGNLTPYESQVLRLIEARATGGSAPVDALRLGTSEAEHWLGSFSTAVVKDAETRGLASRGLPRRDWIALGLLLAIGLALLAWSFELAHVGTDQGAKRSRQDDGAWFAVAGFVLLVVLTGAGRIRVIRATRAGRDACARWLGVRTHLRRNERFTDEPPAAVAVWGRTLAYGLALGANRAAAAALPIGPDDPVHAWSRERGTWRQLRIRYPRRFGAGDPPRQVLTNGVLRLLGWGVVGFIALPIALQVLWDVLPDATKNDGDLAVLGITLVFLAIPAIAAVYVGVRIVDGAVRTWRGAYDVRHAATVVGVVVKVHEGWFAVDDGTADQLDAMHGASAPAVDIGERVRVMFTPTLHHVDDVSRVEPEKERSDGLVQAPPTELDLEH